MTRKSCAVGMRNAIPRNYLKKKNEYKYPSIMLVIKHLSSHSCEFQTIREPDLLEKDN